MDRFTNRRQFLQFITSQTTLATISPLLISGFLSSCGLKPKAQNIVGLNPTTEDDLILAQGLNYHIIQRWNDPINFKGDLFGFNNDFTSFLPFKDKTDEGLLWVNHESAYPEFIHAMDTKKLTRSKQEILKEQKMVGGSILHIKKIQNQWKLLKSSKYNRRLDGQTKIPFSHGQSIMGSPFAQGTVANCSGGQTPWRTFLTSEENYDGCFGEAYLINGKRTVKIEKKQNWTKHFPLPPEHYGWIVEVDPLTGKAEKQILLGRAPHEGATPVMTKNNQVVVYMGEDRVGGFIYKFVSTGAHFKKGTLYAADTINGKWLPLDINKNTKLKRFFKNQIQVLTYSHQAAEIVGAAPQDRPEDIEVHKTTGDVFISLTNNYDSKNYYGSLLKISESKDHDSTTFKASTWVSGGHDSGLSCPDNLCFDNKGNLWVTVDISEKKIGNKIYKKFANNGLFVIPTGGPQAGSPIQVASAPRDAELTGPWFSPDNKTLFLSVQHPGSMSKKNMAKPTSTWPDGPEKLPRPAVVAIQGPLLSSIL